MAVEAPTAEGVLEYLIKSIVSDPDSVRIHSSGDDRCVFSVTVADGDMGRASFSIRRAVWRKTHRDSLKK